MHVALPRPLKDWVDRQVAQGGYGTPSEYIREVLRRERAQQGLRGRIDTRLLAGVGDDDEAEMTAADWAEIRKTARARAAKKKRS
jgi:antitoxin ParD1/3/4